MAPVCMAGRLLLLHFLAFLVFLSFGTKQIESLLVYDRQSLLTIRQTIRNFSALNHDGVMRVMKVIVKLTGPLKPSGEHHVKTKRQQAVTVKNKIVFLLQSS